MMPRKRLALATAHAITNHLANRVAKPSPSVAIKRGTQEKKDLTLLWVHNSRKPTREVAE